MQCLTAKTSCNLFNLLFAFFNTCLQEKLVALEEFCELGRGFHLAERDLAIRGFGSVFGEKQSGEAAHIGMDLFFDILF
jgi:transcription-repair coupling factor (superfamily II helicase)